MADTRDSRDSRDYDVVVIGAGLGGLLSAAQFLRRGQRVALVERLAHPGGRFTAKTFQGAQVSTGAVHMLPFGTNGELAAMLRALAVPHRIHDSEVFASFHVRGRQYVCRSVLQLAGVLRPAPVRAVRRSWAQRCCCAQPRPDERDQTYREWLDRRISRAASPELYAYFERVCHFALSVDLDDVLYPRDRRDDEEYVPLRRAGHRGWRLRGAHRRAGAARAGGGRRDAAGARCAGYRAGEGAVDRRARARQAQRRGTLLRAPMVISNIGPEATRGWRPAWRRDGPEGAPTWRRY